MASAASLTPKPHYLSTRANWEAGANIHGASVRDASAAALSQYLGSTYEVTVEPRDLRQLWLEDDYASHPERYVKPETPSEGDIWFEPSRNLFVQKRAKSIVVAQLGCQPDLKITNLATGKLYYVECKAQGDAGNAHERCAKYASPSVLEAIKRRHGITYHPMGYLFSGELVTKQKYILELEATYRFAPGHLLLWKPDRSIEAITSWFDATIRHLLE